MWKTLDKKKNQGQRRKIIHYIKNWYKREEYQMIIIYIGDKKYIIDKKKYIIQVAPQAFHTYVAHNFSSPHILYHKLFGLDQKKKSGNQALKNLYLDTNSNVRNGKKNSIFIKQ